MKKWNLIFVCLLLLTTTALAASAVPNYVVDDAGLLTPEELLELEERCLQFQSQNGMELVFLTVDSLNGRSAMAYADDYFDANYGADGILLLIAMEEREWHISTCGNAIDAFAESNLMNMEDAILSYLPDGNYYKAFSRFLSDAEYYCCDEGDSDLTAVLLMTIPLGAVIAGIILLIMRFSMNTKRSQRSASNYEVDGSYQLRSHQDLFLYSRVTKQPKPQNNSGSGSGTHRSSTGRTHGGRGGKF